MWMQPIPCSQNLPWQFLHCLQQNRKTTWFHTKETTSLVSGCQCCWRAQLSNFVSYSRSKVSVTPSNLLLHKDHTWEIHRCTQNSGWTSGCHRWVHYNISSSHHQCSYISLTVNFIDADFKLQSVCLKTLEVPQDHDAGSLHGVVCSTLQDWKISDKVFCGTTDNGQSIGNAIGLLGIEHFPCIAHTHYSWL